MQTAQGMTHTLQNQREVIFDLPHPLPLAQDHFTQFPIPELEKLDLSRGGGAGVVTGQIEPCIILDYNNKLIIKYISPDFEAA